ncbi:hypothetical protein LCGC14_0843930 [marine sediment metagenome]|uniref:Uncharacterized protein n=1 Tax=marine sediment metagenome TaxID=412755 RepID=A0A0F9PXH8_9ZZZZ|nr:hypothetical protein [Candidatus Aminicenantes bacterium]
MSIFKENLSLVKKLLVLAFCFLLMLLSGSLFAMQEKKQIDCLTLEQILNLIKKEVYQSEIIKQVKKYGVNFKLDRKITAQLVRVGANDSLLEAIEKNYCVELKIISPSQDIECGASVIVEGWSNNFSGKFLWVFAHVKFLKDTWWPQPGPLSIEPDGRWSGIAFLGGSQDISFDFEIKAMWVGSSVDRMLRNYLRRGEETKNYPGMRLPEGSPSAMVTVKKVSH